jgi:hypothetical protein
LYHCSNYTGNKCVLARYGDEDDKYIIDENSPVLKEAKKRAIEKGLLELKTPYSSVRTNRKS